MPRPPPAGSGELMEHPGEVEPGQEEGRGHARRGAPRVRDLPALQRAGEGRLVPIGKRLDVRRGGGAPPSRLVHYSVGEHEGERVEPANLRPAPRRGRLTALPSLSLLPRFPGRATSVERLAFQSRKINAVAHRLTAPYGSGPISINNTPVSWKV
jgi:hypothetical protein